MGLSGVHLLLTPFGAAQQAPDADSRRAGSFGELRGRAAQAQRSAFVYR